jgi:predicted metalloprotease with PDZ domain|tara:strand:- start:124 stop:540 length:417 start_codon:yes stop_codon:yes gene_type:complete
MEYDSERKAIEVQKKIFFDDFEIALKKKNNLDKFDILNSKTELVDNYIEAYLKENVSFEVNDKVYDINYLGHEYINGTINCYYEVLKVKKIKNIIITDRSLFSSFDEQENLIYFEMMNKLSTIRLKNPNQKDEIIFNE